MLNSIIDVKLSFYFADDRKTNQKNYLIENKKQQNKTNDISRCKSSLLIFIKKNTLIAFLARNDKLELRHVPIRC